MRERKRECATEKKGRMTMNETIRGKRGMRDKTCKVPQDVYVR